jgi:hypothetical protein
VAKNKLTLQVQQFEIARGRSLRYFSNLYGMLTLDIMPPAREPMLVHSARK